MNAIIESWEGLAVLRAPRSSRGAVEFVFLKSAEPLLRKILADLGQRFPLHLEESHEGTDTDSGH